METFTKIVKGKELKKIIDIPKYFDDKDIKLTAEIINEQKNNIEDSLEKLFEYTDKLNYKFPKDIDIDDLIDEMYDRNYNIIMGKK